MCAEVRGGHWNRTAAPDFSHWSMIERVPFSISPQWWGAVVAAVRPPARSGARLAYVRWHLPFVCAAVAGHRGDDPLGLECRSVVEFDYGRPCSK
jgi:hypothetical protein